MSVVEAPKLGLHMLDSEWTVRKKIAQDAEEQEDPRTAVEKFDM